MLHHEWVFRSHLTSVSRCYLILRLLWWAVALWYFSHFGEWLLPHHYNLGLRPISAWVTLFSTRRDELVLFVGEAFSRVSSAVSASLPFPKAIDKVIGQVVWTCNSVLLGRTSTAMHHIFWYAIPDDMKKGFDNDVLVVVCLQFLGIMRLTSVLQDVVIVSTNMMTLVETACSGETVNTNCILTPSSSNIRLRSRPPYISYGSDAWVSTFF